MKTNIITITLILSFSCSILSAQNQNREKLNAYRIAFLTNRLNLTSGEAEKFWPVYNDYQGKKLQVQKERMQLNKKYNQEGPSMSDKELTAASDKLIDLQIAETDLAVKFHERVKEVLPPLKVLRLYQAENQYRTILLNQLQGRRAPGDNPRQRDDLREGIIRQRDNR